MWCGVCRPSLMTGNSALPDRNLATTVGVAEENSASYLPSSLHSKENVVDLRCRTAAAAAAFHLRLPLAEHLFIGRQLQNTHCDLLS